jgi:hypothetical protein
MVEYGRGDKGKGGKNLTDTDYKDKSFSDKNEIVPLRRIHPKFRSTQ